MLSLGDTNRWRSRPVLATSCRIYFCVNKGFLGIAVGTKYLFWLFLLENVIGVVIFPIPTVAFCGKCKLHLIAIECCVLRQYGLWHGQFSRSGVHFCNITYLKIVQVFLTFDNLKVYFALYGTFKSFFNTINSYWFFVCYRIFNLCVQIKFKKSRYRIFIVFQCVAALVWDLHMPYAIYHIHIT